MLYNDAISTLNSNWSINLTRWLYNFLRIFFESATIFPYLKNFFLTFFLQETLIEPNFTDRSCSWHRSDQIARNIKYNRKMKLYNHTEVLKVSHKKTNKSWFFFF